MNQRELLELLTHKESETLEFKREIYRIDDDKIETKKRQRDELIKDVLALANGNAVTAGDIAHLIIGADDRLSIEGNRNIYDIGEYSISSSRILQLVNSACEPALENITSEIVEIDGKRLLIITISPTPYLHETTRRLKPQSGIFSERTVFVRHGEKIAIASNKEREAILQVKRFRFSESRNPPAVIFGLITGASVGSTILYSVFANRDNLDKLPDKPESKIAAGLAGSLVGGSIGGAFGSIYKNFFEIRSNWNRIPPQLRLPLIITAILASIGARNLLEAFLKQISS